MVPNHEYKGDYYVNPCLSELKVDFNSKNGRKKSFSYETKASISFIPKRIMCLSHPIMKNKGDPYANPCLPRMIDEH